MRKSLFIWMIACTMTFWGCASGSTNTQEIEDETGSNTEDTETGLAEEGDGPESNADGAANTSNVKTVQGTFESFEMGDCPHLTFSCGDFGVAQTNQLNQEEQALWDSLIKELGQGPTGNPEMVGTKFEIKYNMTKGYPCQPGYPDTESMTKGEVENILSFKKL